MFGVGGGGGDRACDGVGRWAIRGEARRGSDEGGGGCERGAEVLRLKSSGDGEGEDGSFEVVEDMKLRG